MMRKLILAVALVSGLSTSGCLFQQSSPEERETGIDHVGPADSAKPVRVGQTTRDQTLSILGQPARVSDDGRAVEYTYRPVTGHAGFIAPGGPCGFCGVYPFHFRSSESLYLAFDPSGVLARSASSRDPGPTNWQVFSAASR